MAIYRAALIGCSRMGAFIDNEGSENRRFAYSHAAGYEASSRTELIALSDTRAEVMARAGERYGVPGDHQYRDYREMLAREKPDIVSVATQPEHRTRIVLDAVEAGSPGDLCGKSDGCIHGGGRCHDGSLREKGGVFQPRHQPPLGRPLGKTTGNGRQRRPRLPECRRLTLDGDPVQQCQPYVRPHALASRRLPRRLGPGIFSATPTTICSTETSSRRIR